MESFKGLESQTLISYFLPISFVEQNTEKQYPLLLWSLSWTASKLQIMHMALLKEVPGQTSPSFSSVWQAANPLHAAAGRQEALS